MVKGWKAGLLALSALATTTSAFAQRGEWGGRGGQNGGVERQGGNPGGRGEERRGNWGGGNGNGAGNGAGNPGGFGGERPAPQPTPNRNWSDNGGGNRGWQGQDARHEARPDPRPNPSADARPAMPGRSAGDWQRPGNIRNDDRGPDRGNDRGWADRDQPGRGADWNRGNPPRPGQPQWDNRRPDMGRPGVARPGNGWPGTGWQQDRGRLSNTDRWRDQRRWSNDWRRDNRYDWSRYRQYNRDIYRLPAYRAPMGWNYGYSRFSIGIFLGSPLFSSSYWIDDPYSYRLPPAYGTLRWVRYYDDALLVDIRDGYVVDVIHDFFW